MGKEAVAVSTERVQDRAAPAAASASVGPSAAEDIVGAGDNSDEVHVDREYEYGCPTAGGGGGGEVVEGVLGGGRLGKSTFLVRCVDFRIRALDIPAAVIIGSAQSACLGMKDVRSPLYVHFAAAVVNFLRGGWVSGATVPR